MEQHKPHNKWSVNRRALVIELKAIGTENKRIAEIIGTSAHNLDSYMRRHGMHTQIRERKEELINETIEDFYNG